MRKIISILLALGVILGLTIAAAPVAAAPVCPTDCTPITIDDVITVGPPDFCAGGTSNYLLGDPALVTDIVVPVTLTAGTDSLFVDFPAGTDLSSVLPANVIVNSLFMGGPFSPAAITVTGTHLEFVVPAGMWPSIPAGDIITIEVDGVVNPATAGLVCLFVGYKLACCPGVQFDCVQYTIAPALIELEFLWDFNPTYPGIAFGFVPPFKACGQDGYGTYDALYGWLTDFNLILNDKVAGCAVPCASATMWFVITKCPAGEEINFNFNMGGIVTYDAADIGIKQSLPAVALVYPWVDIVWPSQIHFSSPGDYEICFYLECPSVPCVSGAQIVAQACLPAKVYQWKDAGKILLDEKWNLVSLPLVPFDTSIANLLKSLPAEAFDGDGVDDLISIHHFDRTGCVDGTWKVYGAGQTSLTTMVDGKSYWVRMTYPITASPAYTWWVWGTALPMPPASPKQYPVCAGWNMLGFTSLVDDPVTDYLWNWAATPYVVYGWFNSGDWTTSGWDFIDPTVPENLVTGQGYWAAFPGAGNVYVPGP